MKQIFLCSLLVCVMVSCSTPKTYFSGAIRKRIENSGTDIKQLQYYIDRDVVLSREIVKGETKVTSGIVRFENGKKLNLITLKRNTPGVCLNSDYDKLYISFEVGDDKYLTFGRAKFSTDNNPYKILANSWIGDYGSITYEGKKYFIHSGADASILIKKSELSKMEVSKRTMKGRNLKDNSIGK